MSVMEISHRSKEFRDISERAKTSIRRMLDIPENFVILFTQGGAQMQFNAACYNLLGKHKAANFLLTGVWSKAASMEAAKHCKVYVVENTKDIDYTSVREANWNVNPNADFFHYIDNETANGFEFNDFPFDKVPDSQPIVCDMSSSLLTKPVDWSKYGMVYAASQKQAGIANSCITIVRKDLIGRQAPDTPALLSWDEYQKAPDTYPNTPNTWGIYMCGLNVDYQLSQGGLGEMHARTLARSTPIYDYIDNSDGFYVNRVDARYRSRINITLRIRNNPTLEAKFVKEGGEAGFLGLKAP